MKSILIADPHAGVKLDNNLFLKTFKDFFLKWIPDVIDKNDIESIFILGDLFDNRNTLNIKTLNTVYITLKELLEKYPKLQLYIILGNHDIYYRNTRDVNALKFFTELPNVKLISEMTELEIDGRKVVLCPWFTHREEIEKLDKIKADVCLGHFEINGFELVSGYIERNGITPSLFRKNFNLTFSGHFHLRDEKEDIIYVGNPYHTKWSDCENQKGVYLLDFKNLYYEFIPNHYSPKFKKIFLSSIFNKLVDIKKEVPGHFISLVLDKEITAKQLDQLNYIISKLNPANFNIIDNKKVYTVSEDFDTEMKTPLEYLNQYIVDVIEIEKEANTLIRLSDELAKKVDTI